MRPTIRVSAPPASTNLRSVSAYLQSLWDWTEFNPCFEPTKIRITDVDGLVERKGHFLILDGKKPTASIPRGQEILYEELQKKGFTVIIAFGFTTNDIPSERCRSGAEAMIVDLGQPIVERLRIYRPYQSGFEEENANNERMKEVIRHWFLSVENGTIRRYQPAS